MIVNTGNGSANAMRISSSQPEIIENEKGLLVDFKLRGTRVDSNPVGAALQNVPLGDLQPHTTRVVQWYLVSSLAGVFRSFDVSMEHTSLLGEPELSLIDTVESHTLMHVVRLPGDADDGKPDFLIKGEPAKSDRAVFDSRDPTQPLLLRLSTGVMTNVDGQLRVLATTLGGGSRLITIPNEFPAGTVFSATDSDGNVVPAENIWIEQRVIRYTDSIDVVDNLYIFDYQPDPTARPGNTTYYINSTLPTTTVAATGVTSAPGSGGASGGTTAAPLTFTTPSFDFTPVTSTDMPSTSRSEGGPGGGGGPGASTSSPGGGGSGGTSDEVGGSPGLSTPLLTTTTRPGTSSNDKSSGLPVWIPIVAIILAIALLVAILWALRRRKLRREAEAFKAAERGATRMMENPLYTADDKNEPAEYSDLQPPSIDGVMYGRPTPSGRPNRFTANGAYDTGPDEALGLYSDTAELVRSTEIYGRPGASGAPGRAKTNPSYAESSFPASSTYMDVAPVPDSAAATYGRPSADNNGRAVVANGAYALMREQGLENPAYSATEGQQSRGLENAAYDAHGDNAHGFYQDLPPIDGVADPAPYFDVAPVDKTAATEENVMPIYADQVPGPDVDNDEYLDVVDEE
jgi:type II secretory pathway pseudopilin PulG